MVWIGLYQAVWVMTICAGPRDQKAEKHYGQGNDTHRFDLGLSVPRLSECENAVLLGGWPLFIQGARTHMKDRKAGTSHFVTVRPPRW